MKQVDEKIWNTMYKQLRGTDLHTWLRRKYHKPYRVLELAPGQPDPGIVYLVIEVL